MFDHLSNSLTSLDYTIVKDVVISCCSFLVAILFIIGTYAIVKYCLFKKRQAIEKKAAQEAKQLELKAEEDAKRLKETLDLIRNEIKSKESKY